MDDHYGLSDLSHFRPNFPTSVDPFSAIQPYKPVLIQADHCINTDLAPLPLGFGNYQQFGADLSTSAAGGGEAAAGEGGGGRWPRQETLALLEIRTRLDAKFKEANQKGPLWDEVARIMFEEHGYQRSGKKCREKFENLYKYYKKTKEGKAGRQDGKNYRFFRQLEAIYSDKTNSASTSHVIDQVRYNFDLHYLSNNDYGQAKHEPFQAPKQYESLSPCNSSEFDTSSSEEKAVDGVGSIDTGSTGKKQKRGGKKGWKTKIKDFVDLQMRKMMEKQEEWFEKTTRSLEKKEQERAMREEEWRKQEAERVQREHKFWENERAWMEARDATFMEALHKLTGKRVELGVESGSGKVSNSLNGDTTSWRENDISRLIQLRSNMDFKFQEGGCLEEAIWEEISCQMASLGYNKSGLACKEKWESLKNYLNTTSEVYKKRREDPRNCDYMNNGWVYNHGEGASSEVNEQGLIWSNICDGGLKFMFGNDGENIWGNYGAKLSKGHNS